MNRIMLQLSEDHHRISELLDLLDEQLPGLDADDDYDCQLTLGILDYLKYYPGVFHRPLEELIFDRARGHDEGQSTIDTLENQHTTLAAQTNECRTHFMRWISEAELSDRTSAIQLGKIFLDGQREHIAMEERTFFPLAEKFLTHADWTSITDYANTAAPAADPLFGETVIDRYRDIRNSIRSKLR